MLPINRLLVLLFLAVVAAGCGRREEVPATPAPPPPAAPAPASTDTASSDNAQGIIGESDMKISPGGLPDTLRKYEIETAVVEYWNSWMNRRQVLYIDEYGAKEAYYTQPGEGGSVPDPPYDVSIQANGWRFDYNSTSLIGQAQQKDIASGPLLGVVQDVWTLPPDMQKQFNLRKLGTKKMLGRNATGYQFEFNGKTTVWLWNGVPLFVEFVRMVNGGGTAVITFEAVNIQTGAGIPPEKFKVPANVRVKQL